MSSRSQGSWTPPSSLAPPLTIRPLAHCIPTKPALLVPPWSVTLVAPSSGPLCPGSSCGWLLGTHDTTVSLGTQLPHHLLWELYSILSETVPTASGVAPFCPGCFPFLLTMACHLMHWTLVHISSITPLLESSLQESSPSSFPLNPWTTVETLQVFLNKWMKASQGQWAVGNMSAGACLPCHYFISNTTTGAQWSLNREGQRRERSCFLPGHNWTHVLPVHPTNDQVNLQGWCENYTQCIHKCRQWHEARDSACSWASGACGHFLPHLLS